MKYLWFDTSTINLNNMLLLRKCVLPPYDTSSEMAFRKWQFQFLPIMYQSFLVQYDINCCLLLHLTIQPTSILGDCLVIKYFGFEFPNRILGMLTLNREFDFRCWKIC